MATVIRIKRRRGEDPADVLLLSCKKRKTDSTETSGDSGETADNLKSVLKFAGTVSSKDACVSRPVREAIRKEKLEREYKQHQVNIAGQQRQQHRQAAQQNRYKVIAKHRAVQLDELGTSETDTGQPTEQEDNEARLSENCGKPINEPTSKCMCNTVTETQDSSTCTKGSEVMKGATSQGVSCSVCNGKNRTSVRSVSDREPGSGHGEGVNTASGKDSGSSEGAVRENGGSEGAVRENGGCRVKENGHSADSDRGGEDMVSGRGAASGSGMFCLLDVETDTTEASTAALQAESAASQITCNSVPMVRETVSERAGDDSFVYDLYYTNSASVDFRMLENMLTVEALGQELMFDNGWSDDEADTEDEDSNDEGHWRNDYPDEDPGHYEQEGPGYDYGHEMAEYAAFETETTDQLSDWMSWRCNIEDEHELSSDEGEAQFQTSYDAYYRRVAGELGNDADDDVPNDESD